MKNKSLKSFVQVLVASSLVVFFVACNSSDYNKTGSGTTPASGDTSAGSTASTTDTSASSSASTAKKKKAKFGLGTMANTKSAGMKPDKDGVYENTDVSPMYPGGQSALEDYINSHIEYPQDAIDNSSEGTVNVQFVVDDNGKVMNPKIVGNKLQNGLDDQAIKVVSDMPGWTPGKVHGKNVKTRLVLPITYKVEG